MRTWSMPAEPFKSRSDGFNPTIIPGEPDTLSYKGDVVENVVTACTGG